MTSNTDTQQRALSVVMLQLLATTKGLNTIANVDDNMHQYTQMQSVLALRKTCLQLSAHKSLEWQRQAKTFVATVPMDKLRHELLYRREVQRRRDLFRRFGNTTWSASRPPGDARVHLPSKRAIAIDKPPAKRARKDVGDSAQSSGGQPPEP